MSSASSTRKRKKKATKRASKRRAKAPSTGPSTKPIPRPPNWLLSFAQRTLPSMSFHAPAPPVEAFAWTHHAFWSLHCRLCVDGTPVVTCPWGFCERCDCALLLERCPVHDAMLYRARRTAKRGKNAVDLMTRGKVAKGLGKGGEDDVQYVALSAPETVDSSAFEGVSVVYHHVVEPPYLARVVHDYLDDGREDGDDDGEDDGEEDDDEEEENEDDDDDEIM